MFVGTLETNPKKLTREFAKRVDVLATLANEAELDVSRGLREKISG